MNYLLDKKAKRKKFLQIGIFVLLCFVLFYFRSGIFNKLSFASHATFRPILVLGNNFGDRLGSVGAFFSSKNSLRQENENLKLELDESRVLMTNYNSLQAENTSLKEILGRKDASGGEERQMILAAILSKPKQSPYDTLIIDVGTGQGLQTGDIVFAFSSVPIGRVAETYSNSSKIILFSNSGEKTQVAIHDIFFEIVGRNGGNFEIAVPKDFIIQKGDQAVLPGINPYVVAIVEAIISDPRDSFQKALLTSPVNIQELKFVEVPT